MPQAGQARQRRGEELRRHILMVAKDVFLEVGYERASMDEVASRAATSKRSLYAHFASKDTLFLAALDLIRELYLASLATPDAYADEPAEAVALFCGRFQQLMVWEPQLRTCRLSIAEAERLPASATAYYDAMFASTHRRLGDYLAEHYGTDAPTSAALATDLLGRTALPRLMRTLLGVQEPIRATRGRESLADDVDLAALRTQVRAVLPEPV